MPITQEPKHIKHFQNLYTKSSTPSLSMLANYRTNEKGNIIDMRAQKMIESIENEFRGCLFALIYLYK